MNAEYVRTSSDATFGANPLRASFTKPVAQLNHIGSERSEGWDTFSSQIALVRDVTRPSQHL